MIAIANTAASPVGLGLQAQPALPAPSARLQGLEVGYGSQPVLQGLDWTLLPGQVVGLLGRNGAGKTTLLEALLGLREPTAGSVHLFDQPVAQIDDGLRARIGYVPQHADLFEWMSAAQMLAYFRSFYPRWNAAKVEGLLSRWDIARDKPIGQLSGGQQQRLSIVRALAHDPDLLVLDEPVASLDPAGRRDFLRELVTDVLDRGCTVVFSTHILSDLERVAFNVAFLHGGQLALQAPLDELLEACHVLQGPAAALQAALAGRQGRVLRRRAAEGGGERLLWQGQAPAAAPASVATHRPSLEDLFMELTQ